MSETAVVYVSCSKGDCIELLTLDQRSGVLSRLQRVTLPGNGMPLAISPSKRHLYAAVAGNDDHGPRYVTFAIAADDGTLTQIGMAGAPGRMSHIMVDRSGRHLLGASVSNDLISSTPIANDGTLDGSATTTQTVPSKAHQITTDATNQFAFVPNLGADLVMQLRFDAVAGTFEDNIPPTVELPKGAAPRHLAHHQNGQFAYLLNEEDGSIVAYALGAETGTLSPCQTSSFLPDGFDGKPWGAQILVTPDGRHLYASDRTSSTISHHTIDPDTGHLTKQASTPTEACPRNFAINPSGSHLIAAGEKSDRVACYAIDPATGALTQTSAIETGIGPLWVETLEPGSQP